MAKKSAKVATMDIGISAEHREQIVKGLSALLADSYSLYLMTHNFHWNVTGPQFNSLHTMFMTQYTELWNALDLIAERRGAMPTKSALVIGTGAYARVATPALRDRNCSSILSYSASGRAETFAASHDLEPIGADSLTAVLADVDLVVACSGVHHFVLDAQHVETITARGRALPVIDLALHSDVHPDVRALDEVDYVDLQVIGHLAPAEHADVVESAQDVVRAAVEAYDDTELGRGADPTVVALRSRFDEAVAAEVERVRRRLGDDAAEVVAQSLHRVTSALLHTPTMRARQMAKLGDGMDYARAIHLVFGINVPLDADS